MSEKKRIVGIDLGTTNTCVAHVRNRIPKVVPTDRGNLILPSVVALTPKGELVVGGVAKDQMVVNPRNTIYGAKRLIGRKFDSKVVQQLKGYYSYDIVEGPNGDAAVRLGDKTYSMPQISASVLGHVKTMAEQFLGGPIDEAVISVPAYYNDNQRNAVKEAGKLAGFTVKRIVNEPTAAALAYGFARNLNQKILVYDLGGGTFDVSVLNLHDQVFEVLATGGDTFLGGVDFDNRIIDFVLARARDELKIDLAEDPQALQRIKGAAEAAKIDLSLIPNVTIELPGIAERRGRFIDLRVPLTRDELNALTRDLVDRTFALCDRVLEDKGIARGDIAEVILVGGQSRMPLVQQEIQRHFGKPPRKGVHPDECVAMGAALLAESLGTEDSVTLIDVLSMPIGIALPNGRFRKIIDKNVTIPMSKSFRLPAPRDASATGIDMDIYQGDSEYIVDNEFLGSLKVPVTAAGRRIDFKLDEECLLTVFVETAERGVQQIALATRDTPAQLKAALAKEEAERQEQRAQAAADEPPEKGGILSSIRRIWGGG